MHFDILNRLGVAYECDRQTDRQTDGRTDDRPPLAVARSNILRCAEKSLRAAASIKLMCLHQSACVPIVSTRCNEAGRVFHSPHHSTGNSKPPSIRTKLRYIRRKSDKLCVGD